MHTRNRKGFLKATLMGLAAFVPGMAALGRITARPAWAGAVGPGALAPAGQGFPPGYCFCQYTIPVYEYKCEPNFVCQISWPYVTNMWLEFVDHYDLIAYEAFGWQILCGNPYSEWTSLCCTPWNPQP